MIEAQVNYIAAALQRLRDDGKQEIEVLPEAQRAFASTMAKRLSSTVWASGCASWYLDENGKNPTLWPGTTVEYWLRTRRFDSSAYRVG